MDQIGLCVATGYLSVGEACAGLCRETWMTVPAGLSEADAARVRAGHPIWPRIINRKHRWFEETRLVLAARSGSAPRVRELCVWGADVNAADCAGRTPLYLSSARGHLGVVRELLGRGACTEAAARLAVGGVGTSLHIACQRNRTDIVLELLAHGANTEAAPQGAATSLYVASRAGNADIVRALLGRGADADATYRGRTPLSAACEAGNAGVVRGLLAHGADAEAADAGAGGFFPLLWASWCGHVEVVRALLAAGADRRRKHWNGDDAAAVAGHHAQAPRESRAGVLALLNADAE
jgi:cytohesin